jgi:DNA-binding response OmpR family regulator
MDSKTRILLVEDDPNLGALLAQYLEAKGHEVDRRTDGAAGLSAFEDGKYDLLILDVMMPVKDGFTLAQDVRKVNSDVPIIFLTAKSMKQDTIHGFEVGGDDYLTKPFSMEELLLRVNAVLKRTRVRDQAEELPEQFEVGGVAYDHRKQQLTVNGSSRKLTTKENDLLYLLFLNKDQILDRSEALNKIWGDDNYFNGRSMDVYIAKLRKYLKPDDSLEIINVHGKGFRLLSKNEAER